MTRIWDITVTTYQNMRIEAASYAEAKEKAVTMDDDCFDSSEVTVFVQEVVEEAPRAQPGS